jgi:GTP-sensing pleiotropic transcriptional regulator CodY
MGTGRAVRNTRNDSVVFLHIQYSISDKKSVKTIFEKLRKTALVL